MKKLKRISSFKIPLEFFVGKIILVCRHIREEAPSSGNSILRFRHRVENSSHTFGVSDFPFQARQGVGGTYGIGESWGNRHGRCLRQRHLYYSERNFKFFHRLF